MAPNSLKIKLVKGRRLKFKNRGLKSVTLFYRWQLKHPYCYKRGLRRPSCSIRWSKKRIKRATVRNKVEKTKHRLRLLNIAQRLTRKDVQCILFVAGDTIPKEIALKIHSGLELFQQLEWHNSLCLNKPSHLKEWLQSIKRHDLASKLPELQQEGCNDLSLCCDEEGKRKLVDVHRFLLLRISNCLSNAEVQQLLFLCPSIPETSSQKIQL